MAKKGKTTVEIIQAIQQAASMAYDGSHNKKYSFDGEERKIGLKREEGDPILDSRVMDGFGVRFGGDKLYITYHSQIKLSDTHDSKFENNINQMIADIVSFLKKEYKRITGESLTLTSDGECDIFIQTTSRVRAWVQAQQCYKIGNINNAEFDPEKDGRKEQHKKFRNFLGLD